MSAACLERKRGIGVLVRMEGSHVIRYWINLFRCLYGWVNLFNNNAYHETCKLKYIIMEYGYVTSVYINSERINYLFIFN